MARDTFKNLKNMFFSLKHCTKRALSAVSGGLLCFMIFACSSPLDSRYVSDYSRDEGLSVVISNFKTYSDTTLNASARTIAPSSFSSSGIAKYVITGEEVYDGDRCEQTIAINAGGQGTVTGLKKSFWNFVLHAYSDNACTNEVLHGFAAVDTTYEDTVSFVLNSIDLDTKGSLDLTFTYSDSASFAKANVDQINIYLCDPLSCDINSAPVVRVVSSGFDAWTSSGYNLAVSEINPGYYLLRIDFYSSSTGSQVCAGTYSELVDIEPGRETSDSVAIPDILLLPPEEPENLKVYRIDSSCTPDSYNALIRWDDLSINEEYFCINVYEYNSSNYAAGSLVASIDKSNYSSLSLENDGAGYVSGSVLYSSGEYVLKLKTGKLYDFEICSKNSYGSSAVVSRTSSADIASDASYGSLKGFGKSNASPYLRVNTLALTYNIGGGTYKTLIDEYIIASTFCEYYIYKNAAIPLIQPVAITDVNDMSHQAAYPVLYFNTPEQDWHEWQDSDGNQISQITSFQNITVYADYNLTSDASIKLEDSTVSVTYGASSAASYPRTGTDADGVTGLTTGTYVTLAVNVSDSSNASFTSYDFYINGSRQASVSSSTVTTIGGTNYVLWTFQIGLNGSYTAKIAGVSGGTSYYSGEYIFRTN